MLTYMLDTDISIYLMKRHPIRLRDRFDSLIDQVCISTITLGELLFGAEKSARRMDNLAAVSAFVGRLDVAPFSAKAAAHYGKIRAHLSAVGQLAGPFDMLIGGHARSEGLVLVTNNTREFTRMPGLQVENWVQE